MQLTHFTDLGLRVLMYLSEPRDTPVTIGEIAEQFSASRNHLVKVVHFMAQQGWLATSRGKGGGLALARAASQYRLGEVIRTLEDIGDLIDCAEPPCFLRGRCRLKGVLDEALRAFFAVLDRYTLADVVASPTAEALVVLHRMGLQARV
ncbi:Rrf2 family transcriptional regulator [Vogesella sp. LIG4]|uniref:Rrf2 family transcriptional regulator n=1 Tax=Vogesella sp. LIG4 TaxID=1192162 RepID=UPI00081FFC51|nr:Rrf2 family transcriptional regulator [Vogesella sp. LIG4]SCK07617.1 transcriptional regulator, BadM/Rrf2 family [Vogesella sp. LIG4]